MTQQASDVVLLSPHNDDETLFASFLALRYEPDLVVCYRSARQDRYGITASSREAETDLAWGTLQPGASWTQWMGPDTENAAGVLGDGVARLARHYSLAVAPAIERGGHPQHNLVGELAVEHFGPERVVPYLTYTGSPAVRSVSDTEVAFKPEWLYLKLVALTAYHSQIVSGTGSHVHFAEGLREYLA